MHNLSLVVEHLSYEEYMASGRGNIETLRKSLGKTAIVNLKKTWGGGSTNWKTLNSYLQNDVVREVLRKEVTYINPDIVICGGSQVFDLAKEIFGAKEEKSSSVNGQKADYFKVDNRIFLNLYHPSCFNKKRNDLYNYSAEIFSQISL